MTASLHSLHVYTLNRTTQDRLLLTLVSLFNTSACLVYNNPSGVAFKTCKEFCFTNATSTRQKVKKIKLEKPDWKTEFITTKDKKN